MDIKSKKSKPFRAWLCFFLGISIIISLSFISISVLNTVNGNLEALRSPFVDYKDSYAFKERTSFYFNRLLSSVQHPDNNYVFEGFSNYAEREGENLQYLAINENNNMIAKNIPDDLLEKLLENMTDGNLPKLSAGYNYIWYLDGEKISIIEKGKKIDYNRLDSGYKGLVPNLRGYEPDELNNIRVLLAVKDPLTENLYSHSLYYAEQQTLPVIGTVYILLGLTGIMLLVYALVKRQDKREFDHKLASWSGKVWLEFKIMLSFFALFVAVGITSSYAYFGYPQILESIASITFASIFFLGGFWWFYLMLIDLVINRKKFFTTNSLSYALTWYRHYENQEPWQKMMLNRAYILVAAEGILAFISVCFVLSGNIFMGFIIAGIGIYLIYRYLKQYQQTITDLGKLIDHIENIKNGDMKTKLEMEKDTDIFEATQNLNSIQAGMNIAIARQIKSERMKIDLITNVSHDLKTPLTSIISYVELLNKEESLPEHVKDYIAILSHKSERLKNLIQDLFDLAKASNDNISLDVEKLDLARLIKQTLADMEEAINDSNLTFKVNIPDEPFYILSDGQKLYRVWENLIANALKYSLSGSRVFIDLNIEEKEIVATIKNTANYEMNFSTEEILQRFVRGDESRTSEGSGLGLSIAQSFTQICGGKFEVKIDGDLFKVEIRFTPHF